MRIKGILRAFGAVTAALAVASVAHAAPTKMMIGTGVDPSFSAFYIGKTQEIFDKNGLDVQLRTGPSGSAMVAFVIQNQIQAAFGAEQAGIQNFNIDPNVVLVAEGTAMNDFYGLVARNVATLDALKGKRIGVSRGSASEVFWLAMVNKLNLDAEDYKIVQVDPPEMVAALERGDIDAFTSWEPWLTRAVSIIPDAKVLRGQEGIMSPSVFVYMNKQWILKNPEAAVSFVRSLEEANAFIRSNKDEAAKEVSTFLKLDFELTKLLMGKYDFGLRLTPTTVESFRVVADQLQASGRMKKEMDWSGFIYPDLLNKVSPDRVTYKIP